MNTASASFRRLLLSVTSFGLAAWVTQAHADFLFSDGDFAAQVVGQTVGAPWGPVGGGNTVTVDAQSPYSNVYPGNDQGMNVPATAANPYIVRSFPENAIPVSSLGTYYFNVDFRNNSTDSGDYSIVITHDANGSVRSVALYVTGDTLYADSSAGVEAVATLQPGTWYNLQLTLDFATRTYSGVLATYAEAIPIPSRPFVRADQSVNCVYSDGGTSYVGGTAPDHDLDNWALATTPLPPLGNTVAVKSTAPHGTAVTLDTPVTIELEDQSTEADVNSIRLFLNGDTVTPSVSKPAGSTITTVTYAPPGGWRPASYTVRFIFADLSVPPVSQTNEYTFTVPGPMVTSIAPTGPGNRADATIRVELTDFNTQVAANTIQLFLNGEAVTPTVDKPAGGSVTTVTYAKPGGFAPNSTQLVRIVYGDTSTPAVIATNDFSFQVIATGVGASVINIDFNGLRNVPGPDVLGPTYQGVGAGGGGQVFNGITADSRLEGGGDDDNLTLTADNLLNSFGDPTAVSFTVSPMGGDVGGVPATDPTSAAALFSDYIFNNSAGNTAGESPWTISGLGNAPFVDLYFYRSLGGISIPGASATAFVGQGIFTPQNTVLFKGVPVTDGTVSGTFGSGTAVINGLSIVSPLPHPFVLSASPTGGGVSPDATIAVQVQDYVAQVVPDSIQLLVNGKSVAPAVSKPAGSAITTVSYTPANGFIQGTTNIYTIIFADNATPALTQTNSFAFVVRVEAAATVILNIDFDGARNVPGPRGPGPTYIGQGAAGGGNIWNSLLADSRLGDGSDNDNLALAVDNLLNSIGGATTVGFAISPVGGDDAGAGSDPTAPSALFGDYVFVGSAGQTTGTADFSISGLGAAPYVDLFFYFGANGNFTIPAAAPAAFTDTGIFTVANTRYFKNVPVVDGTVTGTFGKGPVDVMYGLTIRMPMPQPFVVSVVPDPAPGVQFLTNQVGAIQIVLQDYITQVVQNSIQLSLNGHAVQPLVDYDPPSGVTTITYDPAGTWLPDATNLVHLAFSDNATPAVAQTYDIQVPIMGDATAARIVNLDFDGDRNNPGPNSDPLTYVGQGAAYGGTTFNSILVDSRVSDGSDDDNLTVGGTGLLSSIGTPTSVSFTVSPVGGDSTAGRTGGNTDDPSNPTALFSDYFFNNSAGNHAGQSPFTISGLGSAPTVDLYFYRGPGSIFVAGAQTTTFSPNAPFTAANTTCFAGVPVTDGKVTGAFGGGVTVIYGMTIVAAPAPAGSLTIGRDGKNVIVSWSGSGTLQSADELTGQWTDLPGATSPLTIVSPQGHKFYRLRP
jgi:hypothetical protein